MATQIPTFNDRDLLSDIRLNSLNPVIEQVNDLGARLSKEPISLNDIDEHKPTGWYHVSDTNSGGRGEGFVQYYTQYASDSEDIASIWQLHYPKGQSSKAGARGWDVSTGYWTNWKNVGGELNFRIDPNPPQRGVNYFSEATEAEALAKRDEAMNASPDLFDQYKVDTHLLIIVSWTNPENPAAKIFVYQNYINNEWVEAFGHFTGTLELGMHSIDELRDGNRLRTLERDAVTDIECTGGPDDVDLCEGLIENNTIKLSKLRSGSSKYLSLNKLSVNHPVEFKIKPTWYGTFETLAEAKASIPTEDLIDKETSFMVSSENSNRGRIYYWDATSKDFIPLHPEGSIFAEVGGSQVSVDKLKAGSNVSFTMESDGVLVVNSESSTPSESGVTIKSLGQTKTIKTLNIPSVFGSFNDADDEFIFPTTSIINRSGSNIGEIKELSEGSNISITKDGQNGRFKIDSDVKQVFVSKDKGVTKVPLQNLHVIGEFAEINPTTGTLTVPMLGASDSTGSDIGDVARLKSGDGISFTMGSDGLLTIQSPKQSSISVENNNEPEKSLSKIIFHDRLGERTSMGDDGIFRLNAQSPVPVNIRGSEAHPILKSISVVHNAVDPSTVTSEGELVLRIPAQGGGGGGGSGSIQAKTPTSSGGEYSEINRINVVGDDDLSTVADGELSFNLKSLIVKSETLEALNTNFPANLNEYRFGVITTTGLFYWSDGSIWRPWGYAGMSDQLQSLHLRFPEQFVTGDSYSDLDNKKLCYRHISREIAGTPIEDGGLGMPIISAEEGVLHSIYKADNKWTQLFYGLETGNVWSRFYDLSDHWHHWKLVGGVEEGHYAVMTTFNSQPFNTYHTGAKPLPYQVVQDPSENIKIINGMPSVMNKGVYDVTYCLHLSSDVDWPGASCTFKFEAKRGDEHPVSDPIVGTVTTPATGDNQGKFPAVIVTFKNIPMLVGQAVKLYVTVTGDVPGIENSLLNPYKNFMVIEPASSDTKTGLNIAKSFHNTLGGLSFTEGYEVRAFSSTNDTHNPRVFGSRYNKDITDLTPTSGV